MSLWPFRRTAAPEKASVPDLPPAQPERPVYVVGDIHGCIAHLDQMLEQIERDRGEADTDLVFLGDYVDRGPDSAGVLRRLQDLQSASPDSVHCLLGNHDRMMLAFLDTPDEELRWLANGGQETLLSFGIGHVTGASLFERVRGQADALRSALGPELEQWLQARPLWWQSGTLIAVHAFTDPSLPMDKQPEAALLWARPGREVIPREDGNWVVHGHTIVSAPKLRPGHVAIDTGAFRGGPLTCAVFEGGEPRFLSVPAD